MTHDKATEILKEYQLWRRGKPPYDFGQPVEMPFTPEELGEALDLAVSLIEKWPSIKFTEKAPIIPYTGE